MINYSKKRKMLDIKLSDTLYQNDRIYFPKNDFTRTITKLYKNNRKGLEFNAFAGLSWQGDMHPVRQSVFLQSYPARYYGTQDHLLTDHKVHD